LVAPLWRIVTSRKQPRNAANCRKFSTRERHRATGTRAAERPAIANEDDFAFPHRQCVRFGARL
jgi:hypothetical protein